MKPDPTIQQVIDRGLEAFMTDPAMALKVHNYQTRTLYETEFSMFEDVPDDELLATAKAHLDRFAFVGLTERFDDAVQLLYYTFAWLPRDIFADIRAKVTPNRPAVADIPADLYELIVSHNQLDMALYEHATGIFERRYQYMVRDLLGMHFKEHNVVNRQTRVFLRFDDVENNAFGNGWYYAEQDFRWSGPEPTADLFFSLAADRPLALTLTIHRTLVDEQLATLTVSVNNTEIATRRTRDGDRFIFRADVPAQILQRNAATTHVKLSVDRTLSPVNSTDRRLLGMAFISIELAPSTEAQ
ncbi:MAG: hypothetical protein AAF653_21315, partial [Chloroflexota bacterium]